MFYLSVISKAIDFFTGIDGFLLHLFRYYKIEADKSDLCFKSGNIKFAKAFSPAQHSTPPVQQPASLK